MHADKNRSSTSQKYPSGCLCMSACSATCTQWHVCRIKITTRGKLVAVRMTCWCIIYRFALLDRIYRLYVLGLNARYTTPFMWILTLACSHGFQTRPAQTQFPGHSPAISERSAIAAETENEISLAQTQSDKHTDLSTFDVKCPAHGTDTKSYYVNIMSCLEIG